MKDENFALPHDSRGILSMANAGPNTNGSQFFLLFQPAHHLDGKHTVFGKLVAGFDVLEAIEKQPTSSLNNKPTKDVRIVRCGQLEIEKTAENSAISLDEVKKEEIKEEIKQEKMGVDSDAGGSNSSDSDSSSAKKKKKKKGKKEKKKKV